MKKNLIIAFVALVMAASSSYILFNVRDNYITRSNTQILEDIVFNTLARTERSIDQTLNQIGDLHQQGKVTCGAGTTQAISELIFKSSKIKEVVFYADGTECTAGGDIRVLADDTVKNTAPLVARNESISFQVAKVDNLIGLVLNWQLEPTRSVAAFLNTNELVFDVLPPAIRDYANLEIQMRDGTMLGFLRMGMATNADDISIKLTSTRYPLSVELSLSKKVMDAWRTELPLLTKVFGGLALFGIFFLMTRGLMRPATSVQSIKRALNNGSILPHYQPVYSMRSGDLLGFEVLARRMGSNGTMLSPATFIPLIEKYDLGDKLLEVLLRNASKNMEPILDQPQMVTLAFNVTPKQLSRVGFVPWFVELLEKTGVPSNRIILEVTEREVIDDLPNLQKNISLLRDFDITIAIDDVGTGHNGLSSIHQLRADYLKIDKLFVDGIVMDEHASALVKMLIDIGAQYGMQIIAEGVENEAQLNALRALGVDEVQGFYMARPMPANEAVIEFAHHQSVRTKLMMENDLKSISKSASIVAKSA